MRTLKSGCLRSRRSHPTRRRAALDYRLFLQEVPQVFGHFMSGGVTLRSSLGQRLQANSLQFFWQFFVILQQRAWLVACHLLHEFGSSITPERLTTGQQFVEHDAQTENV